MAVASPEWRSRSPLWTGLGSGGQGGDDEHDGGALRHQNSSEGGRATAEKSRSVTVLSRSTGRDALPLGQGASWGCSAARRRGSRGGGGPSDAIDDDLAVMVGGSVGRRSTSHRGRGGMG
jgi:hypothetical protein